MGEHGSAAAAPSRRDPARGPRGDRTRIIRGTSPIFPYRRIEVCLKQATRDGETELLQDQSNKVEIIKHFSDQRESLVSHDRLDALTRRIERLAHMGHKVKQIIVPLEINVLYHVLTLEPT